MAFTLTKLAATRNLHGVQKDCPGQSQRSYRKTGPNTASTRTFSDLHDKDKNKRGRFTNQTLSAQDLQYLVKQ
ncbi:hypothetical protein DPMN_105583 [Dreissena polymorpha]|uniref:Uncharacterized protein n=1 Tax=Dreissena polymorpha TaxID=45954 RepID=A0A9D4K3G7_DREPO|nr:hypothetical protein DPMN_105583 [Dreissena polymorpha]